MRRFLHLVFVTLLTCLMTGTVEVRAAEPSPSTEAENATAAARTDEPIAYSQQWPEPPNTGAMLLRLCLGTVFVLVLCVGSLWLGKPWLQKFQTAGSPNQSMKIEGSVALGNRAMLYLVKIGDTQLVAGTDLTGLKSLIALPASFKEVLDEELPAEETAAVVPAPNFDVRLHSAVAS